MKMRELAMLVAMARTAVLLPRWVRSIFTVAPRFLPPRQLFRAAVKAQAVAMEVPEAHTLIEQTTKWVLNTSGPWEAAQAAPVVASAALPATSALVVLAAAVEAVEPQVLFKADIITVLSTTTM